MTPWEIKAREFVNCNCDYGCPCQFNALPTHGNCEAVFAIHIEQGHFGDVSLNGTTIAGIFQWPGAVHEGRGRAQPIVDVSASEPQRAALLALMAGEESDPFATMFSVYASTMEKMFEPIFAPIDFEVDIPARKARIAVNNLIESTGEPILNKATGEASRARIHLPEGFEYTWAEIGSGTSRTQGNIPLALKETHGQFAFIHLNNHGVVHNSDYAG